MRRKVVMIVAAGLCGIVGTALLVNFVRGAESRALAGEELVEVYRAVERIPSGTAASQMVAGEMIERTEVRVRVRPSGAITSLDQIADKIAGTDILPGEELVAARFIDPEDFDPRPSTVEVPEGMVEITIPAPPERLLGGFITAGERVMIIATFPPTSISDDDVLIEGEQIELPDDLIDGETESVPAVTHVLMHKVLITEVQVDSLPPARLDTTAETGAPQPNLTTSGSMVLTVALTPPEAERLVYAMEFASLWFAAESADVPEEGTRFQTRATVFEDTTPSAAR